jgi:hypothetical protein
MHLRYAQPTAMRAAQGLVPTRMWITCPLGSDHAKQEKLSASVVLELNIIGLDEGR